MAIAPIVQHMGLIMEWLIMDWLILVLVTPLIIVVVVLLYGFVGCPSFGAEEPPPPPPPPPSPPPVVGTVAVPINLRIMAVGTDSITLGWDDKSPAVTEHFNLERRTISKTVSFPIPASPMHAPAYSYPDTYTPSDIVDGEAGV